jgi:hypothetical protein
MNNKTDFNEHASVTEYKKVLIILTLIPSGF